MVIIITSVWFNNVTSTRLLKTAFLFLFYNNATSTKLHSILVEDTLL